MTSHSLAWSHQVCKILCVCVCVRARVCNLTSFLHSVTKWIDSIWYELTKIGKHVSCNCTHIFEALQSLATL